ncbi:unnamed protein product [Vitrella brassicaformis CCMP3155]|uniref:Uncharacterized protein n=1 Tax=Vitrella brassicaformis (strain CCMP3155) TaxID=1169540 RepID=A0A0G4GUV9_VITBC|nr:unnamed protein product [Vitrella brassicaformis CCMP3155]|eukprot:CEM34571.1 unnamed protein product [Vitrella brassicaformis CCMP3155]
MSGDFNYQATQMLLQQGGISSLGCQNWVGMTPIHLKFNAPQLRANAGSLSGEFAEGCRVGRPPQLLDGSESGWRHQLPCGCLDQKEMLESLFEVASKMSISKQLELSAGRRFFRSLEDNSSDRQRTNPIFQQLRS